MGRIGDRERGSAAVEFALTLPVQLLVFLVLMQVLALARAQLVITDGAAAIARSAATTDDAGLLERIEADAFSGLGPTAVSTSIARDGGRGDPVHVEVSYDATFSGPWPAWLVAGGVRLRASAVTRQEFG